MPKCSMPKSSARTERAYHYDMEDSKETENLKNLDLKKNQQPQFGNILNTREMNCSIV